jgi:hypothetical protein
VFSWWWQSCVTSPGNKLPQCFVGEHCHLRRLSSPGEVTHSSSVVLKLELGSVVVSFLDQSDSWIRSQVKVLSLMHVRKMSLSVLSATTAFCRQ